MMATAFKSPSNTQDQRSRQPCLGLFKSLYADGHDTGQVKVPRQVKRALSELEVEVPEEAKDRIELAVMASQVLTGKAEEIYSKLLQRKDWARSYSAALSEGITYYPLRVNKKKLAFILGLKPEEIKGPVMNPYPNDEFVDFSGNLLPAMSKNQVRQMV